MRGIISLSGLVLVGTVFGSMSAFAQSAGLEEAVQPNGAVPRIVTLTATQRSAIFNAVFRAAVKPYSAQLSATVGTPVPHTVELIDLPDNAVAGTLGAVGLKYAMAGNDIVLVDPVQMRVVDVIHQNTKP